MSVIVTLRLSGDPGRFEEVMNERAETIGQILDVAKSHGLIAHRWYGGDGEFMAVDEWPDGDSFHKFFEEAQPQIGPLMGEVGVTARPEITVWQKLDTNDDVGWD